MAHIPDTIISKPRKVLNYAFGLAAIFVTLVGVFKSFSGQPYIAHFILGAVLAYIADRIKYQWSLRGAGGVYK